VGGGIPPLFVLNAKRLCIKPLLFMEKSIYNSKCPSRHQLHRNNENATEKEKKNHQKEQHLKMPDKFYMI